MSRLEGKVAFITGAGRGQGRSHAIRLAEEGADIIAIDICQDIESITYGLATREDLEQTAIAVESRHRRIVTAVADVRDAAAVKRAVDHGVDELGRLDVVSVNAAICSVQPWNEVDPQLWRDTIDVNLTGAWHSCIASIPHLIAAGGGSIVLTGSASTKGNPYFAPYIAAKTGLVGLMRTLANEVAAHSIRVNVITPTGVDTPMSEGLASKVALLQSDPNLAALYLNSLPVRRVEAVDVSNALLFLASDEARYITGLEMRVDAGNMNR